MDDHRLGRHRGLGAIPPSRAGRGVGPEDKFWVQGLGKMEPARAQRYNCEGLPNSCSHGPQKSRGLVPTPNG